MALLLDLAQVNYYAIIGLIAAATEIVSHFDWIFRTTFMCLI